jgi:adenine-specific DNA-methyltransferase
MARQAPCHPPGQHTHYRARCAPAGQTVSTFDNTQNLYIEGDNLDVLKLLRESYLGKVKMIYIDPPYNTGGDFVYKDNFIKRSSDYAEVSGAYDEEGNQVVQEPEKNVDSNGRFHTDWLNMIYPRLKVARDLLTEDGVIFISIDDHEVENLRKICDEILGESNFVGQLILKTATDNNPSQINIEHEYMLCYAKNKFIQTNWTRQSEAAGQIVQKYKEFKKLYSDNEEIQIKLRQWIKAHKDELPQVTHYNNVDDKGVYSSSSNSSNPHPGGYMFDIIHPVTGLPCPKPANGWRWPEKTFKDYDASGEIEWGKDHTTQPHIKKRIETSVEYLRTLIYEDNRASTKMLTDLFDGHKVFENPKPVNVLNRIIAFVTNKDSLVLDFFSGSATTANAVMQLNAADNGKRRYIMIQVPEKTDAKTEAYKCGYKTICEIGKERIRRAGKKIKEEHPDWKGDTGFRVLKLDSSNMENVYYTPAETTELTLFADNIKPDRTDEDLLFQVMMELGIALSDKIEKTVIAGKTVWNVGQGYLMACFEPNVTEDTITAIAKQQPQYFVMADRSLASDNVADNFEQLFEEYSPDTQRRIL